MISAFENIAVGLRDARVRYVVAGGWPNLSIFDREYEAAMQGELAPGLLVRFASIPALIEMKRRAGRPRDLDDIEHLRMIQEEAGSDGEKA